MIDRWYNKIDKMSSVPEKQHSVIVANNNSNKRSFFLRKDSIQKIKCTAMYPFQVAGLKLSNNVIIELIEKNIQRARICIQRALLNFYIVILKLLSTIFTIYDNIKYRYKEMIVKKNIDQVKTMEASRRMRFQRQQNVELIDDGDAMDLRISNENNQSTKGNGFKGTASLSQYFPIKDSYQSRLLAKLERIQRHKSRLNGKSLRLQLLSSTEKEPETNGEGQEVETNNGQENDLKKNTLLEMNSIKFAVSFAKEQFQQQSQQQQKQQEKDKEKSKLQKYCLVLCVHAGLFIMYLQVFVLCFVFNSVKIPSGLLFLIATGTIIGYILIKVSFFHKFSGNNVKKSSNSNNQSSSNKNSAGGNDFIRQARSTKRRAPMLDIDSKTLSKIKLL